jgi:hypothetical protein
MIVLFSPFICIGMVVFAIIRLSRKRKPTYYPPRPQKPPAPKVFVQVIVKDGEVVKVTTQTPL